MDFLNHLITINFKIFIFLVKLVKSIAVDTFIDTYFKTHGRFLF